MLSINDLKSGTLIVIDHTPYQVTEVAHLHMGRGGSSVQTKIKNLKTGQVLSRNFKPADSFEEAEIEKKPLTFLYAHREEYVFQEPGNPKNRSSLQGNTIGSAMKWLKKNTDVTALFFKGELLNLVLPIKMDFKITEAPPGERGDRAQSGTKTATIETGAVIQVPLFINTGDIIRVNTETGAYVERVQKG